MLLCVLVKMVRRFGDVGILSKSDKCGHSMAKQNTVDTSLRVSLSRIRELIGEFSKRAQ